VVKNIANFDTNIKPTWCPGCGNFGIWAAIKNTLVTANWPPDSVLVVYGIGCHGHMVNFLKTYGFQALHGRPIPVAMGAKIANQKLNVLVVAGDGDTYGEGINHLISAARGNHDITLIVHNNETYGLTTGQASPTTEKGTKTKSTPLGQLEVPVNPLTLAIVSGATFIARGFAGDIDELADLIKKGVDHRGFSLIDVLQPCVTFEKIHDYQWLRERIVKINPKKHDVANKIKALELASLWGKKIPVGIFFEEARPSLTDQLPQLKNQTLLEKKVEKANLEKIMKGFC